MGDSQISGTWVPLDRQLHINCLELKAVEAALHHWAPVLQGHQVMIATDNSTVVSYINKQGGTRSNTLLRLVVELFSCLKHIPGCLNVIADHLSRPNQLIPTEWSLHPEIVSQIFGVLGTPVVDMFATVLKASLPQFMSHIPEPRALAVNALSQDWQGRSMYMFPPFPLLNNFIQKLRSTQEAEVILILLRLCRISLQTTHCSSLTAEILCHNRIRDTSRMESRTVCTHGGSHATLQSSRLFR